MVRYEWAGLPDAWTVDGLAACGFEGFLPLLALDRVRVPAVVGNYVVVRPGAEDPLFLERRPAATDRQPHSHYPVEELRGRWLDGCVVVYVGKADPQTLRARLGQYSRYGAGRGSNHQGGRSVWQLSDAADLLVAWRPLPLAASEAGYSGKAVEDVFLTAFREEYGRLPWANLASPSVVA